MRDACPELLLQILEDRTQVDREGQAEAGWVSRGGIGHLTIRTLNMPSGGTDRHGARFLVVSDAPGRGSDACRDTKVFRRSTVQGTIRADDRALSSAWLEHLPYKQGVGGSSPSAPTLHGATVCAASRVLSIESEAVPLQPLPAHRAAAGRSADGGRSHSGGLLREPIGGRISDATAASSGTRSAGGPPIVAIPTRRSAEGLAPRLRGPGSRGARGWWRA